MCLCFVFVLGAPKIVLLDEPSTGMDPQSKRSVFAFVFVFVFVFV